MPLTVRDAVEIGLAANRQAERVGAAFEFDEKKLAAAGLSNDGIRAAKMHFARIKKIEASELDGICG